MNLLNSLRSLVVQIETTNLILKPARYISEITSNSRTAEITHSTKLFRLLGTSIRETMQEEFVISTTHLSQFRNYSRKSLSSGPSVPHINASTSIYTQSSASITIHRHRQSIFSPIAVLSSSTFTSPLSRSCSRLFSTGERKDTDSKQSPHDDEKESKRKTQRRRNIYVRTAKSSLSKTDAERVLSKTDHGPASIMELNTYATALLPGEKLFMD